MNEQSMTLLRDWTGQVTDGWLWSEKLDGCRAYWDGSKFWTRSGNAIPVPADWLRAMPKGVHLDGEIWAGRGGFEQAKVAVEFGNFTPACRFAVFDAPQAAGDWAQRMSEARRAVNGSPVAFAVKVGTIRDCYHQSDTVCEIIMAGGEGIVLRNPAVTTYEQGRTESTLRIKRSK